MSFVSSPPTGDSENPALDEVAGDAFYPALSIAEFRASMRIPGQTVDGRARDALRGAMASVRIQLIDWKLGHVADGKATLAAVAADQIDGESAAVQLYRRAVFSMAAADLCETHADISATGDGRDRSDKQERSADDHRRNAIHAVRDILGVTRTTVELI